MDVVEAVNLTKYFPPDRKMFGRGSISNFVLRLCLTPSLGTVVKLEMWHDNSWFLDQVRIVERSTGEKWDFFITIGLLYTLTKEQPESLLSQMIHPIRGLD